MKTVFRKLVERTFSGDHMGMDAYVMAAHRITGIILLGYFIVHLLTLGSVFNGMEAFDRKMASMKTPLIKFGEVLLVCIALFHCLNGLRLILINLFPEMNEKPVAYAALTATFVLTIIAIPLIF
jgi:succinate dehydrogenase / fumarate reductase cytochrome b subunit